MKKINQITVDIQKFKINKHTKNCNKPMTEVFQNNKTTCKLSPNSKNKENIITIN